MKKLFAVLLSIVLVLSMGTVAFAAGAGSITIGNAVSGENYEIYKILDFTPVEGSAGKGYYTVEADWADFFNEAPAKDYFKVETLDGKNVVSMTAEEAAMDLPALAKAAVAYADKNNIKATKSEVAADTEVVFTGLDLGYYAVDTSLGAICALTNTNSEETLIEKNAKPDITKEVQEDRDDSWGLVNDADIGQVVNYRSEITVGYGVTNYVMHDTMDAGLTFNENSIVVEGATVNDDYTVITECDDGCTFEIEFTDEFIASVGKGNKFTVTYSATLNENAKVEYDKGTDDYEGNKNTVYLKYKNETEVESIGPKETITYTWKLDVFKYTMDGANKTPLAGATFQLLKGGKAISFKDVTVTDGIPTYVVVAEGTEGAITDIVTTDKGDFVIIGLDEGAYTLTETNAPAGYNRANDMEVIIGSTHDDANLDAEYTINDATPAKIEVLNKTGGLFPETGGIGTTIFYVVGVLLMLAAVVVLVSKKRMATFA